MQLEYKRIYIETAFSIVIIQQIMACGGNYRSQPLSQHLTPMQFYTTCKNNEADMHELRDRLRPFFFEEGEAPSSSTFEALWLISYRWCLYREHTALLRGLLQIVEQMFEEVAISVKDTLKNRGKEAFVEKLRDSWERMVKMTRAIDQGFGHYRLRVSEEGKKLSDLLELAWFSFKAVILAQFNIEEQMFADGFNSNRLCDYLALFKVFYRD